MNYDRYSYDRGLRPVCSSQQATQTTPHTFVSALCSVWNFHSHSQPLWLLRYTTEISTHILSYSDSYVTPQINITCLKPSLSALRCTFLDPLTKDKPPVYSASTYNNDMIWATTTFFNSPRFFNFSRLHHAVYQSFRWNSSNHWRKSQSLSSSTILWVTFPLVRRRTHAAVHLPFSHSPHALPTTLDTPLELLRKQLFFRHLPILGYLSVGFSHFIN